MVRRAKGFWYINAQWRRCTGQRQCAICRLDAEAKPHGPYFLLRRRDPQTGEQQRIYVGRDKPSEELLETINASDCRDPPDVTLALFTT